MILSEIFSRVVNMSLTASAVIAVVLLARLVLKRAPKVFSYALWAAVLFRLLCPVSIPSPMSLLKLVDPPVSQPGAVVSRVEYISPERNLPPVQPEADAKGESASPAPVEKTVTLRDVLPYLWLTGTAGMLLYGLISYLRFRRHLTGALPLEENLYLVDHLDSAFVAGLLFPKIYLPSDLPRDRMEYIVAHERHHIRRMDPIAKHLSFLALCVHWFNPLVWAAFFLSGRDMEMSCDEAVVRKLGAGIRADYSESLVELATRRVTVAGSPLAFGEGDTKRRVLNLLRWKEPKKAVSLLCGFAAIAILTACAANPVKPVEVTEPMGETTSQEAGEEALLQCRAALESIQSEQYIRVESHSEYEGGIILNDTSDEWYHTDGKDWLRLIHIPDAGWHGMHASLCVDGQIYATDEVGMITEDLEYHFGKTQLDYEYAPWLLVFQWGGDKVEFVSSEPTEEGTCVRFLVKEEYPLEGFDCKTSDRYPVEFYFDGEGRFEKAVLSYDMDFGKQPYIGGVANVTKTEWIGSADQTQVLEELDRFRDRALNGCGDPDCEICYGAE